ncbi:MAG: hypothetical protein K2H23_04160 [Oscillospiraceae bacterium]|nr:hypothetical protein [Oscillospiraceae bacterium]
MKKFLPILLICALVLTSCGKNDSIENTYNESSEISEAIYSSKVILDESIYLENCTAAEWLEQMGEPVYYLNGTQFEFTLPNNADAESVKVTDTVINSDGNPKYDIKAASREPEYFDVWNGVVSFRLNGHPAAFLSSYLADYEPGACLRSFDIEFVSDGKEHKYTFCVRSDASFDEYHEETELNVDYETIEIDGDVYISDCTADEWIEQKGEPSYYPNGTIFRIIPPEGGEIREISYIKAYRSDWTTYDFSKPTAEADVECDVSNNAAVFTLDVREPLISSLGGPCRCCFNVTVEFGDDTQVYTFCVQSDNW